MGRIPAYRAVYFSIKRAIQEGSYKPGDLLPCEADLENIYSVSRTTIRKAISILTSEGYLDVKQGRGTIVLDTSTTQRLNSITSIGEAVIKGGHKVAAGGTRIESVEARRAVASAVDVPVGTEVYLVQRVQYADGVPIAIIKNYLKTNELPGLQAKAGSLVGLYNLLEKDYNIIVTNATEYIS